MSEDKYQLSKVLHNLPATLPLEGAISIELQEGIPIRPEIQGTGKMPIPQN